MCDSELVLRALPLSTCAPLVRWSALGLASYLTRAADSSDPHKFAYNLLQCIQNDWQLSGRKLGLFKKALKLTVSVAELSGAKGARSFADAAWEIIRDDTDKGPLQIVMDAYLHLSRSRAAGQPYPVIIIDEANRLTNWKDAAALDQLLTFLVYISKQEGLAHVLLATSDTFLTQTLESGASALCLHGF